VIRVVHVVGARPNFMKTAPIMAEMAKRPGAFEQRLVHTGQHYDANMSAAFFADLALPEPDVTLGVGSGSHAEQTARVMMAIEPVLLQHRPDLLMVVGDVNSTLAATLVATKMGLRVAHVEAGLRSRDRTMPEEINRILTDQMADVLFTTEESANENLAQEGIPGSRIHFVGNVMIDSLMRSLPLAARSTIVERLSLSAGCYVVVTLHRPFNVDEPTTLQEILAALGELARDLPVIFSVHPRTRERIAALGFRAEGSNLRLLEPLGHVDFLRLYSAAALVLTDSGGLQEETTYLDIPCLTLRPTTERPVTLTLGTNRLVASERDAIVRAARVSLDRGAADHKPPPPFWDGHAAVRIVDALLRDR
jgi:UDP-N-acetylglucosamine 2-epimerase (non-hydrolysing)